ncbi:MAG: hypothetical protein ACI9C4_001369 [Paraglaciecola sp.]|jgi:hypothetical protein
MASTVLRISIGFNTAFKPANNTRCHVNLADDNEYGARMLIKETLSEEFILSSSG